MSVRVGMVGLGSIAQKVYLPYLSAHPDVDIVSIVSRRQSTVDEALSRYRLAHGSTDLAALLGQRPDLVFVHAPTAHHVPILTTLLDAGIPVYVDKPLAENLSDSTALANRAAERGLLLAVGFNRRFAPAYLRARDRILESGPIEHITALKHRPSPIEGSLREIVYDDLIHLIDLLAWLGGDGTELDAGTLHTDSAGRLTLAAGQVRLPTGTGSFAMHRNAGSDQEYLFLHGAERSAAVENLEILRFPDLGAEPETPVPSESPAHRRGFAPLIDHVLATYRNPSACQVRADLTLTSHRLAEDLLSRTG
ncbi:gfo/Idh/MocA family oxidoreductase [Pseudonocardiaceae bacterium YIM PH 21723]|nr:gfo/Idh/MocA family oxidoreductase [Pseudonocardiaceae bacterium YIM PH 21723]